MWVSLVGLEMDEEVEGRDVLDNEGGVFQDVDASLLLLYLLSSVRRRMALGHCKRKPPLYSWYMHKMPHLPRIYRDLAIFLAGQRPPFIYRAYKEISSYTGHMP